MSAESTPLPNVVEFDGVWIRSLHAYVAFLNLPLVSALRTRED